MYAKIVGLLLIVIGLIASGWKFYHDIDKAAYSRGKAEVMQQWQAATIAQAQAATAASDAVARAIQGAQNEHTIQLQKSTAQAALASSALASLRRSVYAPDSPNAASSNTATSLERASALRDVFAECAQDYQELAAKADRHVADIRLLQQIEDAK